MAGELALERAITTLMEALQEHPYIDRDVAERVRRIENFELRDGVLYFTLERHPHVLGFPTKGIASAGYLIIEQRYSFDLASKSITLSAESCTGMNVRVEWLVDEDIKRFLDTSSEMNAYQTCATEVEVRACRGKSS